MNTFAEWVDFLLPSVGITVALFTALYGVYASYRASKSVSAQETASRSSLENEESRVAEELENTDFGTLWAVTQKRINYYHEIATSQSRRSFVSTQIATLVGFALIIGFGLLAAQASTAIGAISTAAVGIVGAGLSAYIGSTFMKAQSEATAQLRQFFLQPVEFSRLLGAERLIGSLEPQQRAVAVQALVKSMMATGSAEDVGNKEAADQKE
jgi:hypothetical protein